VELAQSSIDPVNGCVAPSAAYARLSVHDNDEPHRQATANEIVLSAPICPAKRHGLLVAEDRDEQAPCCVS
jgi:hypothetical protein